MSSDLNLPLWVQDREEVLQNDAGVEWRGGKRPSPNYSMTNAHLEQEKKYRYEANSFKFLSELTSGVCPVSH